MKLIRKKQGAPAAAADFMYMMGKVGRRRNSFPFREGADAGIPFSLTFSLRWTQKSETLFLILLDGVKTVTGLVPGSKSN